MVAGRVPHWGGLLLYLGLHTRHRGARGRGALAHSHPSHSALDPLGDAADVPRGLPAEPPRSGLDRDAREPALVLEGQAVRALPSGVCGHSLDSHDHPLRGRRRRAHRREPASAGLPTRRRGRHNPTAARDTGGGLPQGLQGGYRHRGLYSRGLPAAEPRGGGRRLLQHPCRAAIPRRLAGLPVRRLRQPAGHARGVAARVPAAGPGALWLRDRGEHDAARARGRRRTTPSVPRGASATRAGC